MIRNIIYYIFFRLYYVLFKLFNYFTFKNDNLCKDCQVMCFVLDKNENMIKEVNDISENTKLKDLLILYDNKKESMYIRIDKEDSVTEINVK